MKNKYNKPIVQYSLDGKIINNFKNAKQAINIVNYDSIIRCCLGKYKTAGGYIWRFKDEEFKKITKLGNNYNIKCKICNSLESIRSMSMHLKWAHDIKTEEYVKKYDEYRPQKLNQINKKIQSQIKCSLCNNKLNSNQHLMYHLSKSHPEITKSEYIIKYLLNSEIPLCKCGCGGEVTILENGNNCDLKKEIYHRDYIKGHWDWEVFTNTGKPSKEENGLLEYIKTIYSGKIQTSVRNILPKLEIDIFLPEINIGIEYNGLYWHSEKVGRYKDYHLNKFNKASQNNIRLIQIFSDEWNNKQDIVKNKLKSIITNNKSINKIYARKCLIKEINAGEKNKFLNQYHIQGEDRSSIKLGLYYNNELISIMTFSPPRISLGGKKTDKLIFELSRYASKEYIVGGSNKLLSYFINNYHPSQIYSYSDNRWTDPNKNMYLKMGFEKSSNSPIPNYFYTKNYLIRFHRYNFNKQILKKMGADINKTESQIMKEWGYTRIWDCGTTKYIKNIIYQ